MSKPDMIPAQTHQAALTMIEVQKTQIETLKRQLNCEVENRELRATSQQRILNMIKRQRDALRDEADNMSACIIVQAGTIKRVGLLVRAETTDGAVIVQAVHDLLAKRDKWKMKSGAHAIENGQLRRDLTEMTRQRDFANSQNESLAAHLRTAKELATAAQARADSANTRAQSAAQRVESAHQRHNGETVVTDGQAS